MHVSVQAWRRAVSQPVEVRRLEWRERGSPFRYRLLSLSSAPPSKPPSASGEHDYPDDLSRAKQSVRTSPRGTLSIACVQQAVASTRHRYRCAIWQKWRAASDAIPQLAAALLTEPQQERRPREDHLLDKNYCALAAKEESHCVNSSLSLAA